MYLNEIDCENERWIKMAQDRVQWRVSVLAMLKLRVLLPDWVNIVSSSHESLTKFYILLNVKVKLSRCLTEHQVMTTRA
jgi:hypothetical protein